MIRHLIHAGATALAAMLSPVAQAQEARDLCADRPGLGTPACTLDAGRFAIELGLGDWTHDKDSATRTDSVTTGDALLRLGLTDSLEAQLGWTAYGHARSRDRATGQIEKQSGVGDVVLAVRQNLRNPDGSGFSLAIMPYATIPAGGSAIGAGDWGAGLLVPLSFDLGGGLSLAMTPEVDAAVDGDRQGRHLAYGNVIGLGFDIGRAVSATLEASAMRDNDPEGHSTEALAGLSFAWQPSKDMQFDIGANIGLNSGSPDREIYLGVVRRF